MKSALHVAAELNRAAGFVPNGVWEPTTGRECRVALDEIGVHTIWSHRTQIEARWIAEGLTQVRVKSVSRRMILVSELVLTKLDEHAKTDVERKRLREGIEATSFKSGLIAPLNEYPPQPAHPKLSL